MKTNDPRLDLSSARVVSWAAVSSKKQDRYSVEDQLKLEREWCAKHGATLVDELVVRGFSRDYWTLADVVEAASRDKDMEAFAKLQGHIRKRNFNVFLCYDADRFGRTQSLVLEIIGRITQDCDALIYTLFDGVWMDAESADTIGTMKAYKARQDVARLTEYYHTGMDNRAKDGRSTSMVMPIFHKRIRDDKGKEIAVVVNEDLRVLWTDLATLILRGVVWGEMEQVLFHEFGHGRNGKPYRVDTMRRMVLHYAFWGHAALNYRQKGKDWINHTGAWIWDATLTPPSPTIVYRNRLPAVYSGEWAALGEQVKAELWRRYNLRGKATAIRTFRFHGLLVCDECGYTMNKATANRRWVYVRCETRYSKNGRRSPEGCGQKKQLRTDFIQDYFHQQLERRLKNLPSILFDMLNDTTAVQQKIDQSERQLSRLQKRLDALVMELADAPDEARPTFRRKIQDTSAEIASTTRTLEALQGQFSTTHELYVAQQTFLSELTANGVDWLWQQPDTVIHQRLSIALGGNQLVVRDGEIIGVTPAVSNQIKSRRIIRP